MNKAITLFMLALTFVSAKVSAQTKMKEYKAGHTFTVSLPDYMNKTVGINASSAIEYKSEVKETYGFVIYDLKEDLALVELNYSSTSDFYDDFMKEFLKDVEKKTVSAPVTKKINDTNFLEVDISYFDKDAAMDIYYLVGIVETKKAFYKVFSWTSTEHKDKFKGDFQKILYSLKD
ncbi:hypothetical protein [Flavobacterium poyangense]|uniref:hypothetical protein n=1 Tax=Flavobacterium poyangense TaxID=2204302 RepID=UPI0014203DA9|nr:hypothetical protein [Flavobacterium sp. JXAS1]